jgi:hypothetical protein
MNERSFISYKKSHPLSTLPPGEGAFYKVLHVVSNGERCGGVGLPFWDSPHLRTPGMGDS